MTDTALQEQPSLTLTLCVERGADPLPAAAELVRRGDLSPTLVLHGAATFLDASDVGALARCGGADALALVALSSLVPASSRVAAAEALALAPLTAAGLAAALELAEGPNRPPQAQARAALDALVPTASREQHKLAERYRSLARHLRDKARERPHRQELQRELGLGTLHPIVGALAGESDFVVSLVPPIADGARGPLVPHLIALLRHPTEAVSLRALALFQRRFREPAAPALSALARSAMRGRDAEVPARAVRALASLGALDQCLLALAVGPKSARLTALAELERATPKARAELDPEALARAAEAQGSDDDSSVARRVEALIAR